MKTFFLLDFYEDNVITNLANTVPWNDIFIVVTEETAKFSGTRDDQRIYASCGTVNSRSTGQPRLLQVQVLMISFCRSSQSLIKTPFFLIYEYFLQIYMTFC